MIKPLITKYTATCLFGYWKPHPSSSQTLSQSHNFSAAMSVLWWMLKNRQLHTNCAQMRKQKLTNMYNIRTHKQSVKSGKLTFQAAGRMVPLHRGLPLFLSLFRHTTSTSTRGVPGGATPGFLAWGRGSTRGGRWIAVLVVKTVLSQLF